MKKLLFLIILVVFFRVQAEPSRYGVGANIDSAVTENKLNYLRFNGVNVFRVSFANNPIFLINDNKLNINEKSWDDLERIIKWARVVDAKLILDPHYFPCMGYRYSTRVEDELWKSSACKQLVVDLWVSIAKKLLASNDVFVAYDLINEPSYNEGDNADFLEIYNKLIHEIRKIDTKIVLLVQPPVGLNLHGTKYSRVDGLKHLNINWGYNVNLSVHMYLPVFFTHQGVWGKGGYVNYPGVIDGVVWDYFSLRKEIEKIDQYAKKNNVNYILGEFSVSCFAPRVAAENYIGDIKKIIREKEIFALYHGVFESKVWDPYGEVCCKNKDFFGNCQASSVFD